MLGPMGVYIQYFEFFWPIPGNLRKKEGCCATLSPEMT